MSEEFRNINYDTTVKIWEYLYKVRVPYLQSRSIDDLKMYGVALSGIKEIDKDIKNQWNTIMIPISQMVTYFEEGVSIRVCHYSDIKEIYDSISDHIHAWKSQLHNGINIGNAPIDDLITMDRFANSIYEHAKYQFTPEILNSITANHLHKVQSINAVNFFNKEVKRYVKGLDTGIVHINKTEEGDEMPERDSLSEFFRNRLVGIRRF